MLLFPITILTFYALALALSFWLSALYVKFRDIAHLWEVFLQAMFYATPIIYPLQTVIEKVNVDVAQLLMLNPVAVIIQNGRAELVGKDHVVTASQVFSSPLLVMLPYVVIAVIAVIASLYFKKSQGKFAENM
ncbi:ABC-2 type transporter [compost metagenome]